MNRIIRKFIVLGFMILFLLASLPFLNRKKIILKNVKKKLNTFRENNHENVKVVLIDDPNDALKIRIALIDKAVHSINICYYRIETQDQSAKVFLGALINAANRGVLINLIVDAKFGGFDTKTLRALSTVENIRVYHYNPINLFKPESLQVSMHNKVMMIDNTYVLSGGRNISDTFLKSHTSSNRVSNDLDVLLMADQQDKIIASFEQLFKELMDVKYCKNIIRVSRSKSNDLKQEYLKEFHNYHYSKDFLKNLEYKMITAKNVTLLYSSLEPVNKAPFIGESLYQIAKNNPGDVLIQSPYVIGDKEILKSLSTLSETKNVKLFTNSIFSSPNYPAFSNYLLHRKKIIKTGIEIYEYNPKKTQSIHTKAYALGKDITAIGSLNLDNRSLFINTEQMLIIKSAEFQNQYYKTVFQRRHDFHNITNKSVDKHLHKNKVPLLKKLIMKVSSYLFRPFQSLL